MFSHHSTASLCIVRSQVGLGRPLNIKNVYFFHHHIIFRFKVFRKFWLTCIASFSGERHVGGGISLAVWSSWAHSWCPQALLSSPRFRGVVGKSWSPLKCRQNRKVSMLLMYYVSLLYARHHGCTSAYVHVCNNFFRIERETVSELILKYKHFFRCKLFLQTFLYKYFLARVGPSLCPIVVLVPSQGEIKTVFCWILTMFQFLRRSWTL